MPFHVMHKLLSPVDTFAFPFIFSIDPPPITHNNPFYGDRIRIPLGPFDDFTSVNFQASIPSRHVLIPDIPPLVFGYRILQCPLGSHSVQFTFEIDRN